VVFAPFALAGDQEGSVARTREMLAALAQSKRLA
jgi:hypothetical protein